MSVHRFTIDLDFKDGTDFDPPDTWDTSSLITFLSAYTPGVFGVAGIAGHEVVDEVAWGEYEDARVARFESYLTSGAAAGIPKLDVGCDQKDSDEGEWADVTMCSPTCPPGCAEFDDCPGASSDQHDHEAAS